MSDSLVLITCKSGKQKRELQDVQVVSSGVVFLQYIWVDTGSLKSFRCFKSSMSRSSEDPEHQVTSKYHKSLKEHCSTSQYNNVWVKVVQG